MKQASAHKIFILTACTVFSFSCSTKKNTVVNRAYHNLTAHYNGYFNARERVKEGGKTLAASHEDRYDRLLSVFKYSTDDKAKAIFPDMDEAIKKSSLVIQRHSMFINGKERCKWIPNNYMVIGKAQFYKHDNWTAIETFQYVASTYKEKQIRFEGLVWLMQAQMQLGKMADAEYLLDFLNSEKEFPKKYKPLFSAVAADYHIKKKEFPEAIFDLKKAAKLAKKRQDKIRYNYILAQLYQKQGVNDTAFALYQKVIKMNPEYEMAFNAKINRARSFDVNSKDGARVKSELTKMLKDEKNADYLDQIYYALAGISMREKDTAQAFAHLQSSVAASTSNTNQKGISYLEMGEITFRKSDFRSAQKYYDSAATFIANDYPDYILVQNKKNNLSRLIKNLNIIIEQDSMLALAGMSEAERSAKLDAIIKAEDEAAEKQKQEEEAQKQKEQQDQQEQQFNQSSVQQVNDRGTANSSVGGAWYFYNQSAISFGFGEFTKKFGNRKLEDNWRRSAKESTLANNDGTEGDGVDAAAEAANAAMQDSIRKLNGETRKKIYTDNLPFSQSQKDSCNIKILEAYYNSGVIYKEALQTPGEAAVSFESMLQRYPENKYKLATYYNLYRCYLAIGNEEKANYYKKIITDGYPDSEYARIITNPNYYKDAQRKTTIMQVFYENTFKAFKNGQYQDVIERKSAADSLFPGGNLAPRFTYLKALAIGRTQPLPVFEASLKEVILNYPKDSVSILAKAILDKMKGMQPAGGDSAKNASLQTAEDGSSNSNSVETESGYRFTPDTAHMVIVFFPSNGFDINKIKVNISNFNSLYYSTLNLKISNSLMDDNGYVMIRSLKDATLATQYLNSLGTDEKTFEGMDKMRIKVFAITETNYRRFVLDKDVTKYLDFFRSVYNN